MSKMASFKVVSLALFLHVFVHTADSAKIAGFPMMGGSQYIGILRIAQELVSRGHEFTIIASSIHKIKQDDRINHLIYKVPVDKNAIEEMASRAANEGMLKELLSFDGKLTMPTLQKMFCEAVLQDEKLLHALTDYDLLIVDTSMPCGHILADYLDIKKVEYCPTSPRIRMFLSPLENLFHLSYIPQIMSFNPGRMNFLQRVKNVVGFLAMNLLSRTIMLKHLNDLKIKYNAKPERSLFDSMKDDHLVLFLSDFALEYSYPVSSNHKMIGPINIQPVKPLPSDLQQLVDSSGDDGVIIVSFGSNVASMLSKEKVDIMAEAFGRLKQKVIWRLKGYIPSPLSTNIKPVAWLPQGDLLAHEKLKLFVSHVGQNSLYEAGYRGVPVVAIPLFADQFDNALVVESAGLGVSLNFHELTADQLYSTIKHVMEEPSFLNKAKHISSLMSDRRRNPVQEAGDWIEYALRHDSFAHLSPDTKHLSWYQYLLIDVAIFLVMVLIVVFMVIKSIYRLICWICCRRQKKQKTH